MINGFGYGDHRKYHLYRKETDMRKGFDSLCGIISGELGKRVMDGDVFVFISKTPHPYQNAGMGNGRIYIIISKA